MPVPPRQKISDLGEDTVIQSADENASCHYSDVIWTPWCLRSPATWLFVQLFVRANNIQTTEFTLLVLWREFSMHPNIWVILMSMHIKSYVNASYQETLFGLENLPDISTSHNQPPWTWPKLLSTTCWRQSNQQATGLDAWASRVKCPARFVSHLHEICIYIWVVYSLCFFCCLFITVTWWYVWCFEWASGNQEGVQACLVTLWLFIISCYSLYKTTLGLLCSWFENNLHFHKYSMDFHV